MREVPVETIPEDILKCDEVHQGKNGSFLFQSLLPLPKGRPSVRVSASGPVSQKLHFNSPNLQ